MNVTNCDTTNVNDFKEMNYLDGARQRSGHFSNRECKT